MSRGRLIALLLVIAAVAALRLLALDHLLVWHDEVFSLIRVFGYDQADVQARLFSGQLLNPDDLLRFQHPDPRHGWRDTLAALSEHPEHAPLYYLIARLAVELPIAPVAALRGVSAVFGLLLIPAVYWLMRELFGRSLAPWVAAVMVASSPLQFLYAQEARQYALWTLLVVASSAALSRAMRRNSAGGWWTYALLMTLGVYSHLLFLLMLPVHAGYGLYRLLAQPDAAISPARTARRWAMATGGALLAFTPWLWVMARRHDRVDHYTAWMQRPVGLEDILTAWGHHLTELFVDLGPSPEPGWLLLLLPIAWLTLRALRRAPGAGVAMMLLILLAYVGLVLGPDLLLGGSRSLHARYALPALLAVQLMVAWSIGDAMRLGPRSLQGRLALASLVVLVALGVLSQAAIIRADTWSTKNFSAHNIEIARRANAGHATLILASESGVSTGELMSLAYHLRPGVRIWAEPPGQDVRPPLDGDLIIALTPSGRLRKALEKRGTLTAIPDTWQWFEASQPRASTTTDSAAPETLKTPQPHTSATSATPLHAASTAFAIEP
ncbi:glycosyl transferase family 39 [Thiocystis violacea]|nr:glycosyl transferase family 39 [Thiocystis violacea]